MAKSNEYYTTIVSMIIAVLSSAGIFILLQLQLQQVTVINGVPHKFYHPMFQIFLMGIGLSIIYPIYKCYYKDQRDSILINSQTSKIPGSKFNMLWLIIPSLLAFAGITLVIVGTLYLSAIVVQILKSIEILFAVVISYFVLSKILNVKEIIGVLLVLTGIAVVSTGAIFNAEIFLVTGLGIAFELFAGICDTVQLIIFEWIMKTYSIHPMKLMSNVGLLIFFNTYFALVIASLIPCEPGESAICINGHLEDPISAMMEIFNNKTLILLTALLIVCVAINYLSIIYVVKLDSAVANFTIIQAKIAFIWVFYLLYSDQGLQLFNWTSLCGVLILIAGAMVYKEIGFKKEEERQCNEYFEKILKSYSDDTDAEGAPLKQNEN